MVSALEAGSITYRQNRYGTNVLVDKNDLSQAYIATAGILPNDSRMDIGDLGSPLADPSTSEYKMRLQLEQRLANAITQIASVEKAQVILGIAPTEPFVRDQQPTTASVVLKLKTGVMFSSVQAQSIIAIVSQGVPGLQQKDVTVVDTAGNVLSGDSSPLGSIVSNQLDYRHRLESDLTNKAESMLQSMLGMGKAIVRVTADVDFAEQSTEENSFDPDKKVKTSEKTDTTTGTRDSLAALGPAGTSSNLTGNASSSSKGNVVMKTESSTIEYENAKIVAQHQGSWHDSPTDRGRHGATADGGQYQIRQQGQRDSRRHAAGH